ncbi:MULTISPECIES: hypothetical protein [unclassified Streptomyces]|uniref:hypothetical protein n=1 Tax=unclassified Streptomyces TaxID=2593676 RepID=UPI0007EC4509|nr:MULTISPECIES: hypothetical protein [unclassified Streptomyces]MCP3767322.1 hypothetical protein [Streptomyces sp. MAR25Y5]OBQ53705.1 hypothetical protein A4U61_06055 [Streptomyces sp. H-KF8]
MEHSPSEVLPVFGDEAVDKEFADWLVQSFLELNEPELMASGRSGGQLVSAVLRDLRPGRRGGLRIIKLVPARSGTETEPHNHRAALSGAVPGNENFISRHLVELDDRTSRLGDHWVMIQYPAGDGTDAMTTLAGQPARRLPALVEEIVKGVLGGWNPDPSTGTTRKGDAKGNDKPLSAAQFVTQVLTVSPSRVPRLREWLEPCWGPAGDSEWLSLEGGSRVLPNPLALGEGSPLGRCQVRLALRGRAHGDLHPGNIVVPVGENTSPDQFWLVDLGQYAANALLARDPAHLLMCLIADEFLPEMAGRAREELLTALTGYAPDCAGPLIPQGLADTVTRVRRAMIDWGAGHHFNPPWRYQWYLALQACALMVAARDRYSDADRWWFFRLAAEACGAYLREAGAEEPKDTVPAVKAPGPTAAPTRGVPSREAGVPAAATPSAGTGRSGAPDVSDAPSPAGSAPAPGTGGPAGFADVLAEIWDVFEPVLRQLSATPFGQVKALTVEYVDRRATDFELTLGDPQLAMPDSAGAEEGREQVLERLRRVSDPAENLRTLLLHPVRRMEVLARMQRRPVELRAFVQALGDLLHEIRRVLKGL